MLAAVLLLGAVLLPGQLQAAHFGPATSLAQAREMPEFHHRGRVSFFNDEDPYRFWIMGGRSGLSGPTDKVLVDDALVMLEYAALAALLPLLLLLRRWLPSARVGREAVILPQLVVMSAGLFFLAHAVLFKLYLPNRYVKWSLPLAFAVAGGLALAILIDALVARLRPLPRGVVAGGLAIGLVLLLAIQPTRHHRFRQDEQPRVSEYLQQQPTDILVAGASSETDGVPSFARRSVLTAREFALAYHLGYYEVMRQRTLDLLDAYYAESPRDVLEFARRYEVDLFLVNRDAFERREYADIWGFSFQPFTSMVRSKLEGRSRFALLQAAERCPAFVDRKVAVVELACLETLASRQ